MRRSKNISKLHVTGLCEENSPVTGEFPAQMASNAEDVAIWWRHHVTGFAYQTRCKPSSSSHWPALLVMSQYELTLLRSRYILTRQDVNIAGNKSDIWRFRYRFPSVQVTTVASRNAFLTLSVIDCDVIGRVQTERVGHGVDVRRSSLYRHLQIRYIVSAVKWYMHSRY